MARRLRPVVQIGLDAMRQARRRERSGRKPRMTSLKLRAMRFTRLVRDAYAQLRDDYEHSARRSMWREVFVIVVASAAAGAILGAVMSALWNLVASAL